MIRRVPHWLLVVGIVSGVLAAAVHETLWDRGFMFITSLAVAIPNFWLGLMLALVFSIMIPLFPPAGYSPLSDGFWKCLSYLILPSITLAAGAVALIARMTRACMLDVLRNEYIRTAKAKGVRQSMVIFKHGLRNAIIPVVTVIGMTFANLMGGAVVTESIFNIPGVGRLLIKSVFTRDYPVIEGVVIGDFQDTSTELSGFFLQEEDSDSDEDPLTSEGIFVYDNGFGTDVSEGQLVRVMGEVDERSSHRTSRSSLSRAWPPKRDRV